MSITEWSVRNLTKRLQHLSITQNSTQTAKIVSGHLCHLFRSVVTKDKSLTGDRLYRVRDLV